MSLPTVTGPITGGQRGWPFASSLLDMDALGYREAEYFIEGTAQRYLPAEGVEFGRDGRWQAEPAGEAAYKTRVLIYHPKDPAKFNGTVLLTWNNVTAGYDLFSADSEELLEGGFAIACLTTQMAGITGLPPVRQGLNAWDPERYGDLVIPSDDFSYDIFTQAARLLGPDRDPGANDMLNGLKVERIIGQGASQSAARLSTYYNAIQPQTHAFDGIMLLIYFGRGSPLEVGDAVVNIGAPQQRTGQNQLLGANLIRDDLETPVFIVNSELEAVSCYGVRQDNSDRLRSWEAAGTCHVSQQARAKRDILAERDGLVQRPAEDGINAIPIAPVYDGAYHHMHLWLKDGVPPPVTPWIQFVEDEGGKDKGPLPEIVRDSHGIAKGGIRLPQAEVPLAQNSAIPLAPDIYAILGGSSHPFDREKILALYGDKQTFLAQFELAARRAVDAQVMMPREIEKLSIEAGETWDRLAGS